MESDRTRFEIREGMDIIGSDGEKIGSVDHFEGDYMIVKQGFLFSSDNYIPISAVTQADADQVYLGVTKDAALNQGWDTAPGSVGGTTTTTGSLGQTGGTYTQTDAAYAETGQTGGDYLQSDATVQSGATGTTGTTGTTGSFEQDTQPFDHEQTSPRTHINEDADLRVELAEEELTAQRRSAERGEVEIRKNVISEEQTLEVPVTEERVNVSRRVVDRDVTPGETVFEGGTIEVPVRGEEVDVQKEARVREEIEVSKEAVQGTERVTDTVRREEVEIADNTATRIDDTSTGQNRTS